MERVVKTDAPPRRRASAYRAAVFYGKTLYRSSRKLDENSHNLRAIRARTGVM
jgi:hypothetical protein